ncbi:hypothetical protein EVAR_74085_1 [Eumeta japonica]|uniref:RNA-directed DNA polymerase from mobile element jockey n=1 Tax=Eumeta variegata TaxID=151549 RepID=A0A4C1SPJ8_EUMVA|nr:hypothetical protein EVAR_74085_1 [Eumeta japonica]
MCFPNFPNNWKVAVVKMIPEPGKDLTKAESYRPISITNNVKALRKTTCDKIVQVVIVFQTINLALDDNMVLLNKRIDWFKSEAPSSKKLLFSCLLMYPKI